MSEYADLWETLGGVGEIPPLAGAFAGKELLVLGTAPCLWDDLAVIDEDWTGDRMAVNWAGAFYDGPILHLVSLHDEYLDFWIGWRRRILGADTLLRTHSFRNRDNLDDINVWALPNKGGGSGLFGVLIGLLMGYRRIVLAGMPMDDSGYFYTAPSAARKIFMPYGSDRAIQRVWQHEIVHFAGRVSSLSGLTREWLGSPNALRAKSEAAA